MSEYLAVTDFYKTLDEIVPGESIRDARIYFVKMSLSAVQEMHEYSQDPRMYDFFEFKPQTTLQDTEKYLRTLLEERMGAQVQGRKAMYWFVKRKEDNKTIGSMSLVGINLQRLSAEWGYALGPQYWGQGYILDMQEMLKAYMFDVLKLNRLWGVTRHDNERTKSSVLAAGVTPEGILRQFYRDEDGVFYDGWQYSILRSDFIAERQSAKSTTAKISKERIASIIAKVLDEPAVSIDSDMSQLYMWDSLNHLNIIVGLEEETGYKFTPVEIVKATSIANIYEILS
jgi:ribosomal-protein-alanine N-acetyltransferase